MRTITASQGWQTLAILTARLIFAGLLFAAAHGPGQVLALKRPLTGP